MEVIFLGKNKKPIPNKKPYPLKPNGKDVATKSDESKNENK